MSTEALSAISYQPFLTGQLANRMNQPLNTLRTQIEDKKAIVYCYVISTIKNLNEKFYQAGNGPNFQGNLITLCTCKHFMRAFMEPEEWIGKWVAGFSVVAAGNGSNALVYLMKVGLAFDSHQSLWLSYKIPDETKQEKASDRNRFGDVYRPKELLGDDLRFEYRSYEPPVKDHSHFENGGWHSDINYFRWQRAAALLVGKPNYSFLWNKPSIFYANGRIHRGQKKTDLSTLLDHLKESKG